MNLNSEIVYNERALTCKKRCLLVVSLISIIWCIIWCIICLALFPIIRREVLQCITLFKFINQSNMKKQLFSRSDLSLALPSNHV